jgi:hypothetical protein
MVTNPQSMTSYENPIHAAAEEGQSEGFGGRVMERLRQAMCGLHGHDTLLHFNKDRISLRCVSCGHETPGWELNEVPPTVTARGDARRHKLPRPQLVSARRIA